jgi:hypothetical protein
VYLPDSSISLFCLRLSESDTEPEDKHPEELKEDLYLELEHPKSTFIAMECMGTVVTCTLLTL